MVTTKFGRLLVVDDETKLMTALCETLSVHGYEAHGAVSGADALQALQEQGFDLLLIDLMMPEMDGIELLKNAKKIDPNVGSIIMTGYGTVQTAIEAMKAGAFDYVLKPFKLGMLLPALERAMEMRRLKDENLQLRESMAIYNLATTISQKLDMDLILNKIADAVIDQCEADEMSIMLPAGTDDELYVAIARCGQRAGMIEGRITISEGVFNWATANRETLLRQGFVCDPRFAPIRARPEIEHSISIPLLVGGECVGVLNVNSKRRASFPPGKIRVLNILAGTAASTIQNARLYEELKQAERNYRSIFENATEGVFRADRNGRYLLANPALARILGYDHPDELLSLASGMDYERLLESKITVQSIEHQHCRRDGASIWVSENIWAVHDDQDRILYFEGIMKDITESKIFRQEMARLDRLNLVGEMAAGLAHEIRNPMTVVRGYLQLLQLKEGYAEDRKRLTVMIEELDRANAIITEFLSLARNAPVKLQRQSLNNILTALLPLIQADAVKTGIAVNLKLAEIPELSLDEKQIRQVVLNFVRNGLEAMDGKGVLTIKTYLDEDEVVLAVNDQGNGISPDVLEKIGTPFFSTKEKGTGLGLAVCYRIAEQHNAKIKVETGAEGTTFAVYFPPDVN